MRAGPAESQTMSKKAKTSAMQTVESGLPVQRGKERQLAVIEIVRKLLYNRADSENEFLTVKLIKNELEQIEQSCSAEEIRGAFRALSGEGLLKTTPKVGTSLRRPSEPELTEFIGLRWALESYAATRLSQMEDLD